MVSTTSALTVPLHWLEARPAQWRTPCSLGAAAMVLGAQRAALHTARRGQNAVADEVVLAGGAAALQMAGMAAPGPRRRLAWHRCSARAP
jgi:hypothetical protein